MDFLQKLDYLMDQYNLNRRTLSQGSGIPYTTIDGWYKKGYEGLKLTTFRRLAEYFNTTLDFWVLDDVIDPNYGKTSGFKIEYEEMAHIQKYRALDTYGQDTVSVVLNCEHKRCVEQAAELRPMIRAAAYGGGGEQIPEIHPDEVPIDEEPLP